MTSPTSRLTSRHGTRDRSADDRARQEAERARRVAVLGGDGSATWDSLVRALGVKPKGGKLPECITEDIVARTRKGLGFRYVLSDGKEEGLTLRVGPKGGGVWWLQYRTRDGKRYQLKVGAEDRTSPEQARAEAQRIRTEVRDGGNPAEEKREARVEAQAQKDKLTLRGWVEGEYWEKHLKGMKDGHGLKTRILRVYESLLDKALADLSRADIEGVLQARKDGESRMGGKMKPATVHRDWQALCAALNVAVDKGQLAAMPTSKLPEPLRNWKGENRERYVGQRGPEERERFLLALEKRERLMQADADQAGTARLLVFAVRLAWNTGMRRSEILGLRDKEIGEDVITLPGYRTKTGKARAVRLNAEAKEALKLWKLRNPKGEFFPGYMDERGFKGPSMVTWRFRLYDAWNALCAEAKIADLHLHDLRHTFATNLRKVGAPLDVVRDAVGHSDIRMTQRYAHVGPSEVADYVNRLSIGKAGQP